MSTTDNLLSDILSELKQISFQLEDLNAIRNGDIPAPMSREEFAAEQRRQLDSRN